jgi:pyridoxal 5'-phosphate synthase / NAD(P)H-hydrate epimerase
MIFARHCLRRGALNRIFQTTARLRPQGRESLRPTRVRMRGSISARNEVSFLDQKQAQQLDVDLMSPELGFSIYQLMELAGLSCAGAISAEYPTSTHPNVIILAGPGNNGGDGLVCARHLHHFGYSVSVAYPKFRAENGLYAGLVTQLTSLGVRFVEVEEAISAIPAANVVVDAMFGFSFTGVPREPFSSLIGAMARAIRDNADVSEGKKLFAVVAVDVPSGFHVEDGDVHGLYGDHHPHMLISLTAPKLCARTFRGDVHYLGGRFVPPAIADKYELRLPIYPGSSQCVKISGSDDEGFVRDIGDVRDIRKMYEPTITASLFDGRHADPFELFGQWFEDAKGSGSEEPNAMAVTSVGPTGQPSTRYVLLRGFDTGGFTFYTNYKSRKGSDFSSNNKCAATFFWESMSRSVRIEGTIDKLDPLESDAYWASRPRSHQLGALCSHQSAEIINDAQLLARYEILEQKLEGKKEIPRPDFWGGYMIQPCRIEFWQGRTNRLHERLEYSKNHEDNTWHTRRLSP